MAGNSPLSTSAARRARSCRNTPAYAPALSHATLLLAPEAVRGRHAAKLVLTAPWSRLLSLRICFVRRGSPDPGRTGLRRSRFKPRSGGRSEPGGASPRSPRWPRSQPLSPAAQRRIGAWRRQPQVAAMGQSDPLPRTQHGQGSVRRQRFDVNPAGLGKAGDDRSFLAWGLRHQATTCRPIRVLVARARNECSMGPRR